MSPGDVSYWPAQTDQATLDLTAGDLLQAAAEEEGERLALVVAAPNENARCWTYQQLWQDARRAAQWLLARFSPGERVVVWAPNVPEWIILQYGAALAGLVLVTANPALRARELEYVITQSQAAGLAYSDEFRGTDMASIATDVLGGTSVRETIRFRDWYEQLPEPGDEVHPLPRVEPTAAAQVQYTSGTTGSPKGALLHHRGLVTNAHYVHLRAGFPRHGVWLTALPLFHTASCGMSVLGTAASRGTLVLCHLFDPELVLDAIQRWRADLYAGVPAMHLGLLRHPRFDDYDVSSVRLAVSGGDAVPPDLVGEVEHRFGCRFSTVYGQTELSPIVTQTSPDDDVEDKTGTAGRPLWNVELRIADPVTGEPTPVGEAGEICARGYQAMLGYFQMPERTAETVDADGWVHTGDLGTLDERGYLRVTGRIKDMIIRGGENVYPREIETVLSTDPRVSTAVVVGIPNPQWGEVIAAVIQPADGQQLPLKEELHELIRANLAPAKTPVQWYYASALPANAMGKLQKFRIREQILSGQLNPLP